MLLKKFFASMAILLVSPLVFSAEPEGNCKFVFGSNFQFERRLMVLREFDEGVTIDASIEFPKRPQPGAEPLIGKIYFGRWNHAERGEAKLATPKKMSIRVERNTKVRDAFKVIIYFDDRLRSYSFSIPFSAIDQAKSRSILLQVDALTNVPTGPMAPMLQYSIPTTVRLEGSTALPIKEIFFSSTLPFERIWPGYAPKPGYSDELRIDFSRLTVSESHVSTDPFERAPSGRWSDYRRSEDD